MNECYFCQRLVSDDYVALADECPRCHAKPFLSLQDVVDGKAS